MMPLNIGPANHIILCPVLRDENKSSNKFAILYLYKIGEGRGPGVLIIDF